ncbi:hypothetical protein J6590_012038 [Homalodisca vitripennis]|nr:hypothetical protein J6590_012038 [Homalodisca vitripennis]
MARPTNEGGSKACVVSLRAATKSQLACKIPTCLPHSFIQQICARRCCRRSPQYKSSLGFAYDGDGRRGLKKDGCVIPREAATPRDNSSTACNRRCAAYLPRSEHFLLLCKYRGRNLFRPATIKHPIINNNTCVGRQNCNNSVKTTVAHQPG